MWKTYTNTALIQGRPQIDWIQYAPEGYYYRTPVTWSGDSSWDHWSAGSSQQISSERGGIYAERERKEEQNPQVSKSTVVE